MEKVPLSKLKDHIKNNIDNEQQQTMADLLTELLVLYANGPEHIRKELMFMCEGIADILPDSLVEKCEDYAMYRMNASKSKEQPDS